MVVTKHISLDNDCIAKMKPYVEKHKGSFSAAIREVINQAGRYNSLSSTAVQSSLFKWMLNEIDGILLPYNVLDGIIDPGLINSMEKLEKALNQRFSELEWDVGFELKYDSDTSPSNILIEIKGDTQKIRFLASLLSQYLVKNSPEHSKLKIDSLTNLDKCIKVELSRSNKEEAFNSLIKFFGRFDEAIKAVKSKPGFWNNVIALHLLSNYNMVTINRNCFEDLLAGNVPLGEITIENLAKKPIQEIPFKEMLSLVKEVYETSRVADRVEIEKDNIILFHSYRNKEAIKKLKEILVALLRVNGHLYDAKTTANMIVLTHQPEIEIKINEIVNNLKTSNSRLDQELMMFLVFLKGLKNMPDIPLTSLGKRIGISLIQEYEKENNIKNWNLETFQSAFEIIDSKLYRESEWKPEGKNMLYTIKKCGIAAEGILACHTAREILKGALNYAFKNKAELEIRKLLTHGDNYCEVLIRV